MALRFAVKLRASSTFVGFFWCKIMGEPAQTLELLACEQRRVKGDWTPIPLRNAKE